VKFFIPSDFEIPGIPPSWLGKSSAEISSIIANAKLERDGMKITLEHGYTMGPKGGLQEPIILGKHVAHIVYMEPIEKCSHPPEKVMWKWQTPSKGPSDVVHYCECGAKVKVKEYEEIK
jgi:hypothetical protein